MEQPEPEKHIDLGDLRRGEPGASPLFCSCLSEAAAVALEVNRHPCNGTQMHLIGYRSSSFAVRWTPVSEQARRTWRDEQVATEFGAYGIAFLVIKRLTGMRVVERARKGTGFDWWLGAESCGDLFQGKARLEVSGILTGTEAAIETRVQQKLRQTEASDGSGLPAWAVVVEFGAPQTCAMKR